MSLSGGPSLWRFQLSDEMQWSYEVRGMQPQYKTPVATRDPNRLQQKTLQQGATLRQSSGS